MKDKVKRLKYYLLISAVLVIVTKIFFSAIQPSAEIDERVFLPVVFPVTAITHTISCLR
jgi:hypothetical protein